jgi:chemotaxis protein MotB
MKKTLVIMALASLLLAIGCVSKKQYADLEGKYNRAKKDLQNCLNERNAFNEESTAWQSNFDNLNLKYRQTAEEKDQLTYEIARLKKSNEDLKSQIEDANKRLNEAISAKGAGLKQMNDELNASREELNKMKEDLLVKEQELNQMQEKLGEKEQAYNNLQNALNEKEKELADIEKKITSALLGFTDKGLSVETKNGKVYVSMEEKLLFSSGSWEINSEGAAALKEIAKVLAQNPDINVMIEGHTDNVPLKGKNQIKDNWDLSVMRATSVTKILLENKQVLPDRIIPCGRSEFAPVLENKTPESRAKNRRTEIILTPKVDELLKMINKQ